jgi:hypothetical protein
MGYGYSGSVPESQCPVFFKQSGGVHTCACGTVQAKETSGGHTGRQNVGGDARKDEFGGCVILHHEGWH